MAHQNSNQRMKSKSSRPHIIAENQRYKKENDTKLVVIVIINIGYNEKKKKNIRILCLSRKNFLTRALQ